MPRDVAGTIVSFIVGMTMTEPWQFRCGESHLPHPAHDHDVAGIIDLNGFTYDAVLGFRLDDRKPR
jgi:hypothetical protein